MKRLMTAGPVFAVCLLAAGLAWAASNHEVVTNPPTALSATMTSTTDANGLITTVVSGKVSPKFRTEGGTNVRLVCQQFCALTGTCASQQPPVDPTGSAPCSGDLCPNQP